MKKTDLAYIAGIIDGEGSITMGYCNKSLVAKVTVVNTKEWLLQWLRMAFGGSVHLKTEKRGKDWKPCYMWSIGARGALEFLQSIYPYLRLKKPQAEVAIKFLKMRAYKHYHFTEAEKAIGEAQRIVMKGMNKTGEKNISPA